MDFKVEILKAIEDEIPATGLYQSLCKVVEIAKKHNYPYVLFCEDDHQFTDHFNFNELIEQIYIVDSKDANILSGGVSWFDYGVKLNPNLYWINSFTGMQFTIIFSRFYNSILTSSFGPEDVIDKWLSNLSTKTFLLFPFISIQKDFGYSDVTLKNNEKGIVGKYYINMSNKLKTLDVINKYISTLQLPDIPLESYDDIEISVYVIKPKSRVDRFSSIVEQFQSKKEFNVKIIEACEDKKGSLDLWLSIKKSISLAKKNNDEIIIICEDDHVFTEDYNKYLLFRNIFKGAYLGADIILGGVSYVDQAIVVDKTLCWINEFFATQFVIIYSRFYDQILSEKSKPNITASGKFSEMTNNKYVIHPFISIQANFGYSDIEPIIKSPDLTNMFNKCSEKLQTIRLKSNIVNGK